MTPAGLQAGDRSVDAKGAMEKQERTQRNTKKGRVTVNGAHVIAVFFVSMRFGGHVLFWIAHFDEG